MADAAAIAARLNARLGLKPAPKPEPAPAAPGPLVHSHRSTTSSRTPGRVNQGTVAIRPGLLVTCGACGGRWFGGGGSHAPHWVNGVLVDCVNRRIE
jgi:hypothetical protein